MRFLFRIFLLAGLLSAKALWAQQKLDVKHRLEALTDFYNYLSIPNTSDNQRGIQQTLDFISDYLEHVGVQTEIWEENQTRYLYGHRDVGATKTILIYLQLDALEVDAAAWNQLDPFTPVLKMRKSGQWQPLEDVSTAVTLDSTYIFARGASDSKGPSFALLYALKFLSEFGIQSEVNLKIIGDTAEEKGSKDLNALVQSKAAELKADGLLILDGTRSLADVPTLTFGARGIAQLSLTTYGARSELHSGQYGGIAANPWYEMTTLIKALVDENERVLVTDFDPYKETEEEERYFRELTLGGYEELENRIGAPTLSRYQHPQQDYQHPALILKGMYSGNGNQKIQTKIPSEVTAAFELRLTPETPAERQFSLIESYLKDLGYTLIENEPNLEQRKEIQKLVRIEKSIGSIAFRTPLDATTGTWLEKGIQKGLGTSTILKLNTTGGSQPIGAFIEALNIDAVALRIPNPDATIHAANENIALKNLFEGIESLLGILTTPFE